MNLGHRVRRMLAELVAVIAMLLWCPTYAAAHLVTTGMGPVYDGIGHFLMTPEDCITVLALALYSGLRGTVTVRRTMFLLPFAWFSGGVAGLIVSSTPPQIPVPVLSFLVLGTLVAADLRMPDDAVSVLSIVIGLIHGFFNGSALKEGAGVLGLLGIMVMLFVLVALASASIVSLKEPWTRIAVRVAGSWIFASGLLMIGWLIRGST